MYQSRRRGHLMFVVPFLFPDIDNPGEESGSASRTPAVTSQPEASLRQSSRRLHKSDKTDDINPEPPQPTPAATATMADEDAPASKRAKQEPAGKMNISHALMKPLEVSRLGDVVDEPVTALEGIGEEREKALAECGVKTVRDFGTWKHFLYALSLTISLLCIHLTAPDRPLAHVFPAHSS